MHSTEHFRLGLFKLPYTPIKDANSTTPGYNAPGNSKPTRITILHIPLRLDSLAVPAISNFSSPRTASPHYSFDSLPSNYKINRVYPRNTGTATRKLSSATSLPDKFPPTTGLHNTNTIDAPRDSPTGARVRIINRRTHITTAVCLHARTMSIRTEHDLCLSRAAAAQNVRLTPSISARYESYVGALYALI